MPTNEPLPSFQGKIIEHHGDLPTCDVCGNEPAPYDVPTTAGPWGNLGEKCFSSWTTPSLSKIGFYRHPTNTEDD